MSEFICNKFHEILFWPLELSAKERLNEEIINAWVKRKNDGAPWRIIDPYDRGTAPKDELRYAEFLYFHPFVRQFLYPEERKGSHLHILAREDVRGVEVEFGFDGYTRKLKIDRIHLYLFQTWVALLVVEVEAQEPLPRSEVMAFLEEFRKVYAPFWIGEKAGKCPRSVRWLDGCGNPIGKPSTLQDRCEQRRSVETARWRKPPVSAHWDWLLGGLRPSRPTTEREDGELYYDQIEDERMMAMCFLTTAKPHAVSIEDQQRLCFYDEPEVNPRTATYSPEFLQDFVQKHCYDRYWHMDDSNHSMAWMSTRYLCSGYGFTVLGSEDKGFVKNAESGLLAHFRHHYFQLGLIAHFHRASLLQLSRRFSESVLNEQEWDPDLNRDFARFVTGYWFNEVSNQLQGRELFQFWSGHLGNQKLLEHVMSEKRLAAELEEAAKMREDSTQVRKLTKTMAILTIWLVPLTAASVFIAWFDIEFTRHHLEWLKDSGAWWSWSVGFLGVVSICGLILRNRFMREKTIP